MYVLQVHLKWNSGTQDLLQTWLKEIVLMEGQPEYRFIHSRAILGQGRDTSSCLSSHGVAGGQSAAQNQSWLCESLPRQITKQRIKSGQQSSDIITLTLCYLFAYSHDKSAVRKSVCSRYCDKSSTQEDGLVLSHSLRETVHHDGGRGTRRLVALHPQSGSRMNWISILSWLPPSLFTMSAALGDR